MIKMKYKNLTMVGFFLLILLISIISVKGIGYIEKDDGTYYYEIDSEVRTQKITINDLITLLPKTEPVNPVFGMIYLDINSKKLRFYDGLDWYNIALETEKICNFSKDCKEWGDCINNYQAKTCLIVNDYCSKSEIIEKQDCSSENPFQEEIEETYESVNKTVEETTEESGITEETVGETESETAEETEEQVSEENVESEDSGGSTITGQTVKEYEADKRFLDFFKQIAERVVKSFNTITGRATGVENIELFEITFKLEKKSLSSLDKLGAFITIRNPEKKTIPIRLYYIIKDKKDNEIYIEFEEIRVDKEYIISKKFDSINLDYGTYSFILKAEYSGTSKEFKEDFTIKKII